MTRFKAITLILVAAIANPLCCCFGVESVVDWVLGEQDEPVAHACCASNQEFDPANGAHADSDEPCPHELERVSKILDGDLGQSQLKPAAASLLAFASWELDGYADRAFPREVTAFELPDADEIPLTSCSRTHCVYLL